MASSLTMFAAAFILSFTGGVLGFLGGLFTLGIWYTLGIAYAVAMGHVAIVAAFPGGIDAATFVVLESLFIAGVVLAGSRDTDPRRFALFVLVGTLGLATVLWLLMTTGGMSITVAGLVLIGLVAFSVYGCHRYAIVRLELRDQYSPHTHE